MIPIQNVKYINEKFYWQIFILPSEWSEYILLVKFSKTQFYLTITWFESHFPISLDILKVVYRANQETQ